MNRAEEDYHEHHESKDSLMAKDPAECEVCGERVPDYRPEYCCNGRDCACQGRPIEQCICDECLDEISGKEEFE